MPASQYQLAHGCATDGTGFITIVNMPAVVAGGIFEYLIVGDLGTSQSAYFSMSELPLTVPGLANDDYTVTLTADTDSSTQRVAISCGTSTGGGSGPAITNIVATAPTTAGGFGTLAFDVSASTATVNVEIYQVASPGNPGGLAVSRPGIAPGRVAVLLLAGVYNIVVYEVGTAGTANAGGTVPPYAAPVVRGCTDPNADNYDEDATEDDGSCEYTPPPRLAHFVISPALGLRFWKPAAAELPAFDNRLLGDERPLDTNNPGYCQLI
jgi:hypothetical protein